MADDKWTDTWLREAYPPNLKICYSIEELENEINAYYKSEAHPKKPITLGIPYHVFEPAVDAGISKRERMSKAMNFKRRFIGTASVRILVLMSFRRYGEINRMQYQT